MRRVVVAVQDPNPLVNGRGIDALRRAGCDVSVGCLGDATRGQNRAFFVYMTERRPLVTLKAAMTLDGKIAAWDRSSRWITGEPARLEVHRMRSEADAVAVGIGTVLQDDPELTVRLSPPWPREPYRVVVDSHCRIPLDARILGVGQPQRTLIATTAAALDAKVRTLEARGVTLLRLPARDGRVDLSALLSRLATLEVTSLLLEGGSELNAAFLEAGLVDRVRLFVAPMLLGGRQAPGPVGGTGRSLKEAFRLHGVTVRTIGDDLLVEGDLQGR
jgi:diaminohydroxyphosphoribosylaminopyrimidine deaminase/5-amino-6-(5-phosphoribosylamino)uracil reductase